jgi:hypothetical protein
LRSHSCFEHADFSKSPSSFVKSFHHLFCRGDINVEVLDETENVLAAYALPKAALSFSAALTSSRPRTKYASIVFVCLPERIQLSFIFFVTNKEFTSAIGNFLLSQFTLELKLIQN